MNWGSATPFFFKSVFYKNIQAEIPEKNKYVRKNMPSLNLRIKIF